VRTILANHKPDLAAWDQPQVARDRKDCDKTWPDLLAEFTLVRNDGLALFDELTDADLARTGMHPLVGELSVRDVIHEWPFHDRDHLKQLLENIYIVAMEDYTGQTVRYGKEVVKGDRATVDTFIVRPGGSEIPVRYRLRMRDGTWLASDVAVEGVSLVNNYRSSFGAIVRKDGMSGLIDALDKKVNAGN